MHFLIVALTGEGKNGKVHPKTGHEGLEGE
jgi:hypothetical protein